MHAAAKRYEAMSRREKQAFDSDLETARLLEQQELRKKQKEKEKQQQQQQQQQQQAAPPPPPQQQQHQQQATAQQHAVSRPNVAAPFDWALVRPNTPPPPGAKKKRRSTTSVWGNGAIMRLKDGHPAVKDGKTHVCTLILNNGKLCGTFLRLSRNKNTRAWVTSVGVKHLGGHARDKDTENASAIKRMKVIDKREDAAASAMAAYGVGMMSPLEEWRGFTMTKEMQEKASQAMFYTYSSQRISQKTFDCPYYRRHLLAGNPGRALLSKGELKRFVRGEFRVFIRFVSEFKLCLNLNLRLFSLTRTYWYSYHLPSFFISNQSS